MKAFLPNLYLGDGTQLQDRAMTPPEYEPITGLEIPENYVASPGLREAVNVALVLGQPLLITGEPGTGKTRLAASIAWELGFRYLEFHTKTGSTASDMFYHYDALRRFQDVQLKEQKPIEHYITCQAVGTAILLTNPTELAKKILPEPLKLSKPVRSVVLIDEIDKAPRDLPNDVLNEIETMQFRIKETLWEPFKTEPKLRPVLILTSNSEKNLPDAFLRRCVFFHIEFPDANDLKLIVKRRFKDRAVEFSDQWIVAAVALFADIRKLNLKKRPATAEFIGWISILKAMGVDIGAIKKEDRDAILLSCSVLAKGKDDLERLKKYVAEK